MYRFDRLELTTRHGCRSMPMLSQQMRLLPLSLNGCCPIMSRTTNSPQQLETGSRLKFPLAQLVGCSMPTSPCTPTPPPTIAPFVLWNTPFLLLSKVTSMWSLLPHRSPGNLVYQPWWPRQTLSEPHLFLTLRFLPAATRPLLPHVFKISTTYPLFLLPTRIIALASLAWMINSLTRYIWMKFWSSSD